MNRLQITIILLLAIYTISFGQNPLNKSEESKTDSTEWKSLIGDKFKISHPSDWDVDTSGQMGSSFLLFSQLTDADDKFRENVNLIIQNIKGYNLNLDQYVELSEGQIKTMITEGDIVLSERIKSENGEYHKIIYSGKQGIYHLKFEQYFWVIEEEAFVLTLTCEVNQFEKFQEMGERVLDSFEIK